MAVLKSIASGNFSAAATWGVIHVNGTGGSSSFLDSRTSIQGATTSYVASTSFQVGSNLNCIGVLVQCGYRATSPTAGSTVSVQLWNATTSAQVDVVTINITDLPSTNLVNDLGWIYFKFGSSRALTTGTNYQIRVLSSHANHFFAWRDGTSGNWNRAIVTDTTAAPGASDTLLINGEHTGAGTNSTFDVTMDITTATSTVYGLTYIDNKGSLIYGTSASTNYRLQLNGNLFVRGYGKLEIGTSGSTFPSTSTAELQFQPASAGGIGIQNLCGDIYLYGDTRTYYRAKLGATANAAATSLTTDVSTGWKNGDVIAIASTTRTPGQREHRTMNADAVGTTVTISAGLTNQHEYNLEGLISADIGNLTRNVKIASNSTTNTYIISNTGYQTEFYANQVEFQNLGTSTTQGLNLGPSLTDGKFDIRNCSFYNLTTQTNIAVAIGNQGNVSPKPTINFINNVFYGFSTTLYGFQMNNPYTSGVDTIVITDNLFIGVTSVFRMFNLICTGNTFTSAASTSMELNTNTTGNLTITHRDGAFDNTTIYSATGNGLLTGNLIPSNSSNIYMRNLLIARVGSYGISNQLHATRYPNAFTGNTTFIIKDFKIFGCGLGGIVITSSINGGLIYEDGYLWRGGATLPMPRGIDFSPSLAYNLYFNNIRCGITPSNVLDAFSNENIRISAGFSYGGKVIFSNSIFSGGTEFTNQTAGSNYGFENGYISSLNHNQVSGSHKLYSNNGITQTDTSIFNTASPSIRLTPQTASFKHISGEFKVAVNASSTANISVYIRKSSAGDGSNYNGDQPRIICRRNYAAGTAFTQDIVIATASSANGSWEQVQGTTPTVDYDCVLSFYVDCNGTVGWVNIDDIATSTSNDTRGTKYWGEFNPYVEPDYSTGSSSGGEKSFVFFS